ncbi:hypothetical protein GCM10027084_04130 [Pseudoxanthomonas sangjuensis]|uniref:hypothetical protein n=1 Tax=Pseudoxanthomonas sangjuensis TaxID=1503750 RepID=UPI001390CCF0|nr:hypothetical protein [Pseudoxanthomonas sangjuensis]
MHRLAHLVDGEWKAHSYPPVFRIDDSSRHKRILAGVPAGDPLVIGQMAECLHGPFSLLYVLHTPRGEAAAGRYQSPYLTLVEIKQFLQHFGPFLSADGRYDLWLFSQEDEATVVWDRHNQLFAYGPLESFVSKLKSLGFTLGAIETPFPVQHMHYYRAEFDKEAKELLAAYDWSYFPLRPEDEQ